ncbi:small-conductance mechanosensitive channel [Leptolyngbya sp. Heron Island J]|uniref:mechanosensitive ion channel family protein n=1 Tax=Leptolyngbya sp. Heron Island J TaxID=1385935 RepID=UPI0003B9DFF0|nr:mechanosensitive ion channel family protein [Leptolyngbya sp. Heron Island J]ESA35564.1 small-conductance mechanosensitive channel [Leptolyngbya sp. Heron Island J]
MAALVLFTVELTLIIILCCFLYFSFNWGSRWVLQASPLQLDDTGLQTLRQNIFGIVLITGFLLFLLAAGFNGWIVLQGESPDAYTLSLIQNTPQEVWLGVAAGVAKSICLLVLAGIAQRPLKRWLVQTSRYVKQIEQITANDDSIDHLFQILSSVLSVGIWLLALIWCARFLQLPEQLSPYLYATWRIYLIISIGIIVFRSVSVVVDTLDALSQKYSNPNNLLRFYDRLQHLIPFLKRCLECVVWVYVAMLVVGQITLLANLADYGVMAVNVIALVFFGRLATNVMQLVVSEVLLSTEETSAAVYQRRVTITPLVVSLLRYVIYFGTVLFLLKALNIDPGPILAGAGIVGLTVGLGAQNLVKDVVSGFFILFEDYYLVGDFIETETAQGTVQSIELRTTRILHPDGQVQILRNGDIGSIVNYSKHPIDAAVEVSITYEVDPEKAFEIIERVGAELCEQEDDILEPTHIEGVETFSEEICLIYTRTKVKPGKHLRIQRLLRQRCLVELLKEDIEVGSMDTKLVLKSGFEQLNFQNQGAY